MKKLITLLSLFLSLSLVKADYWTQKADFGGQPVRAAIGFSIGNKGYIGTGQLSSLYSSEFWEYDQPSNVWTQKSSIPISRGFSVGFSIVNKGYVIGGTNSAVLDDCWEYDPLTNIWTQKANYGGGASCQFATSFVINNKGYVCGGKDGTGLFINDLWEFDPVLNTWTQKTNFGGALRFLATGFAINQYGYVGSGLGTADLKDFWRYDPVTNSWTQVADINSARREATSFTLNNFGYVGTGDSIIYLNDFYQYNPNSNTWTQKASFGGTSRELAVGFSIGNKGYIGTGDEGSSGNMQPVKTFWEYTPDTTTGIQELPASNLDFTISPNPAKDYMVISYPLAGKENIYITITDAQGKKVYETKLHPGTLNFKLQTLNYSKGIYFVELNNGKQKAVKKFVKQ